ncbi:hypothetical protein Nepgr_012871 [Nepenthes gracilis]|uniref:Uncharacterized protein n=1 Tax=Nepenthes gracilis TaxID=150966 RepID=A0AAD3SGI3_NEPGR|nr:hypothetical protein Nepgr_012871 [Nepenthes gracilis]
MKNKEQLQSPPANKGGGHTGGACSKCGVKSSGDNGSNKEGHKKGPWTAAEDALLTEYVRNNGERHWKCVQKAGLMRCGKSCRLRWTNHLRPDLKKGAFTPEEERTVLELHERFGNKWSKIAAELPGRTDNEIKNFWNAKTKRKMKSKIQVTEPQIPEIKSKQEAPAFHLQQNNQQSQPDNDLSSIPSSPLKSFISPTSFQDPSFDLSLSPFNLSMATSNSMVTMQEDPIFSLMNDPVYEFKFLPEEEDEDYTPLNSLAPAFSSVYSSITQPIFSTPSSLPFDYETLYNISLPGDTKLEFPLSEIQLPATPASPGGLGFGYQQDENPEGDKPWRMDEETCDLHGDVNENGGMTSVSAGKELDDCSPVRSYGAYSITSPLVPSNIFPKVTDTKRKRQPPASPPPPSSLVPLRPPPLNSNGNGLSVAGVT